MDTAGTTGTTGTAGTRHGDPSLARYWAFINARKCDYTIPEFSDARDATPPPLAVRRVGRRIRRHRAFFTADRGEWVVKVSVPAQGYRCVKRLRKATPPVRASEF